MLQLYKRQIHDTSLTAIRTYIPGSWIRIISPTENDFSRLIRHFPDLNHDFLKDTLDPYEMPRIETEEDYMYMVLRVPDTTASTHTTVPLAVIIGPKAIITIEHTPFVFFEHIIAQKTVQPTTQRLRFTLSICYEISKLYGYDTQELAKRTKELKKELHQVDQDDIVQLATIEETLSDYISSLVPSIHVIERLLTGKYLPLRDEDRDVIDDLMIEYKQSLTLCQSIESNTNSIREAYAAILNVSLNKTMKVLTAFTIVMTIPTIIASIFGMNIPLPFSSHPFALLWILVIIVTTTILAMFLFRYKRWM